MSKERAEQVTEAIRAIRELHRKGQSIPRPESHKDGYGQNAVAHAAERLGLSPEAARQARQLADPTEGFTNTELDAMCEIIRTEQPNQDDRLSVFGTTHVIRLLTVPKNDRAKMLKTAVANGWSVRLVEAEIAARFGKRRSGGRKRALPEDAVGLLTHIEAQCETWRRWMAIADPERVSDNSSIASLADLPESVRKQVRSAGRVLLQLQEAVDDELRRRKPGRAVRSRSQTE